MQVIYVIKVIVNAFYRIVANAILIDFNTCSYMLIYSQYSVATPNIMNIIIIEVL